MPTGGGRLALQMVYVMAWTNSPYSTNIRHGSLGKGDTSRVRSINICSYDHAPQLHQTDSVR